VTNRENVGGIEMDAIIELDALNSSVKQLNRILETLDPSLRKTERGLTQVEKSGQNAGGALGTLSKGFGTLLPQLTAANIAANLIQRSFTELSSLLKVAMTAPIQKAAEFETTMANVGSIIKGDSTQAVKGLSKEVLNLSRAIPKDANDLGAGLYQVLSAGITDSADAMKVLDVSARSAVAGLTDTKTAVDVITTVLNAYDLSADQAKNVSDALFVAVRDGKTTFEELATGMGRSVSSASLLGVNVEQLSAAIAALTLAGQSTDEASTAINAFLTSVIQASDGTGEAAKAAKQLGIDYSTTALKTKGLQQFIADVTKAVGDDEVAMEALTGNVRAFRAVAVLAGKGAGNFSDILGDMGDKLGSTDEAFAKNADTIQNFIQLARNELNATLIETGQDLLPELKQALEDVKASLVENREEIRQAASALGGALVDGIEGVVKHAPEIIQAISAITQTAVALTSAVIQTVNALNQLSGAPLAEAAGRATKRGINLITGVTTLENQLKAQQTENQLNATFAKFQQLKAQGFQPVLPPAAPAAAPSITPSKFRGGGGGGRGGKSEAEKEAEKKAKEEEREREKELEAVTKLEEESAKLRLDALRSELEAKKQVLGLSKEEERSLKRLNALTSSAFEVSKGTKFSEVLKGMTEGTKDLGKDFEDVSRNIDRAKDALKDMTDQSIDRVKDLKVELANLNIEFADKIKELQDQLAEAKQDTEKDFAKKFGSDGLLGEEQKNTA
jgi:TP901 family phage tail tape measure protein